MFDFKSKNKQESFKNFDKIETVADVVDQFLPHYSDRVAIRYDRLTHYDSMTYETYRKHVAAFIRFLNSEKAEQRVVATLSKNRIEWDMVAMGSFYTANIIFPIDTKTNAVELAHLFKISPPDYILVSREQAARFREIKKEFCLQTKIIIADLIDVFEDENIVSTREEGEFLVSEIVQAFSNDGELKSSSLLKEMSVVLGHYTTSGTTGLPKVVRITHGNIIEEMKEGMDVINFRANEDILNIGPYTHIATLVEFLISKTKGFSVTYFTREPDEDNVLEDEIKKIKDQNIRIRALMAVPKFWIFLMKDLLEELKNKFAFRSLYNHLIKVEKNDRMVDVGTIDKAKLAAVKTLLRNKMGGYFSYGISSSMKLDGIIVEIFGKLGITILDIYGATECTGIIARNRLNEIRPGSCGKMISSMEWRLADKRLVPGIKNEVGILELKGPTIAECYLGQDGKRTELDKTSDGYFKTGDLCFVNEEGWVYLVGREKELTKWKDGSYIDPQHLSNLLVKNIFIKDAMVVNSKDADQLNVYLYPDYKKIKNDIEWQQEIATGVSEDQALKKRMKNAIEYAQSISNISAKMNSDKIFILPRKLERTPTHKIKFIFELDRLHLAREI